MLSILLRRGICQKTRNNLPAYRVCAILLSACLMLGFTPAALAAISPVGASFSGDGVSSAVASLSLPTVFVQEGGYHIGDLALNTRQFFTGALLRPAP